MTEAQAMLKSNVKGLPDVVLKGHDSKLTIGRNSKCKIIDIRCPKESTHVTLEKSDDGELCLISIDAKTNEKQVLKHGDKLDGPGYSYSIELSTVDDIANGVEKDSDSTTNGVEPTAKRLKTESPMTWTFDKENAVHIGRYLGGGEPSAKIAAFDFDGTLSVPKSGAKFPKDGKDFKLWNKQLPMSVNELSEHRFVIFSNQLGVSKKKQKWEHVQQRIEGILKLIGDKPAIVFCAIEENLHRKPRTGMFDLLQQQFNGGIEISLTESFYVGDAAGRKSKTHKDHSSSDLTFAINVGLPFLTPEQFIDKDFQPKPLDEMDMSEFTLPAFDPRPLRNVSKFGIELTTNKPIVDAAQFQSEIKQYAEQEKRVVVLMVGIPGAGKSFIYEHYFKPLGFTKISRDQLKTMEKCEKELISQLSSSSSSSSSNSSKRIVIDNTNYDLQQRKRWMQLAKEHKAKIIAVWLNIDKEHALHNNAFRRALNFLRKTDDSNKVASVPSMVIYKQAKEMVPPTPKEGYDKIFRLSFTPTFERPDEEKLYFMFLAEK